MNVEALFKRLSYGKFSNLSLSNEGDGTIRDSDKNKILTYINDSLKTIYTRFNLREKEVIINQYLHITNYHLDKRYAQFNVNRPEENYPYILDLPAEQFEDDAVKILMVRDRNGNERVLNDNSHPLSLYTPYPTTLLVPNPIQDEPLSVVYQALHPEIGYGKYNSEVHLPSVLEPALETLIAYHQYSNMNTQESLAKSQEQYSLYESLCFDIEQKSQVSIETISNYTKFNERGFI